MLRFAFVTALSLLSPTLLGTLSPELPPASAMVAGRVTNAETGEPLGGVQIHLRAHGIGTLTNEGGAFWLRDIPHGEATLRFSQMCFHPVSVDIVLSAELAQRQVSVGMPFDHESSSDSTCRW